VSLKVDRDIRAELGSPTLIAGWPGMGSVGVGAVNYLRRSLEGEACAHVDLRSYFSPDMVVVEDGLARFPDVPSHVFYHVPGLDLILFESEAQVPGEGGTSMMNEVLDFAQELKISAIYTAAALAVPMSHTDDVQVVGVSNTEGMRDTLNHYDVDLLEQGHVSGLNGLLLGFAALRDIPASCLLATMPHHVIQMPNPRASREIVRVLQGILDVEVDLSELDEAVDQMGKVLSEIEEKIRSTFSSMQEPESDELSELQMVDEEQVPQYVMEKIERLFVMVSQAGSVGQARETAAELKLELDKWSLYAYYEDRFLNLFRENPE